MTGGDWGTMKEVEPEVKVEDGEVILIVKAKYPAERLRSALTMGDNIKMILTDGRNGYGSGKNPDLMPSTLKVQLHLPPDTTKITL